MAKDKQPDHRAAGSADTPPTGVACAVAGNAETAAADWRTDLETALRERDAVLPETTVARVNQALAYLLWGRWRAGQELRSEEWALLRGANPAHADRLAENPSTPASVLEALAKDEDARVRAAVARNPSTPVNVLATLAKDRYVVDRAAVAENPSTPASVLEALAEDEFQNVWRHVLENPSTPKFLRASLLEALAVQAKDQFHYVREPVAENPSTVGVLEVLSQDKVPDVRQRVAENPSTPATVLNTLTRDKELWVRSGVAGNPATPVTVWRGTGNPMTAKRTFGQG